MTGLLKSLEIKKSKYPAYQSVIDVLVNFGYTRVPMVLSPGDFAVRGSIIDLFAVNHYQGLRLDYFEGSLERLTSFSISNQCQISDLDQTLIEPVTGKIPQIAVEIMDTQLLASFKAGDFVVHEDYGIAQFVSLEHRQFANREGDYLFLQYKGNDKLYVPMSQIHLVHKYAAADATPTLNALHDKYWKTLKSRTKRVLTEMLSSIYDTMAIRQTQKGFSFSDPSESLIDFEQDAGFELTADQADAWQDIVTDMHAIQPMDRLICGDVGFGKTELMMRAAFLAVEHAKQVLLIVPTTLLADQHFERFTKRFLKYQYRVGICSRFYSPKQNRQTLRLFKDHQIDILIGTHRLLQSDLIASDLGLLMVDEEQRFGVQQKEFLKRTYPVVDILASSATPIPRTLYMSLTGSKSISKIETPPKGRKPIQTVVCAFDEALLAKFVNQELDRNGQLYYLYNSVRGLLAKRRRLEQLFPQLKICHIHGQMAAETIETRMRDFFNGDYDLLLSTTIIENGIDLPNVNTIIIDGAEHLGLSQIHQLRGRVGRSDRQAYALVMHAPQCSDSAKNRLQAIQEYVSLGSGYQLAMKDLEIRGAGTLLGEKQHGHMTAVGFELYCKLLTEIVDKIQGKKQIVAPYDQENPYISDSYIQDTRQRLAIYRRFMQLDSSMALDQLMDELKDRFGELPKDLKSAYLRRQKELQ